MVYDTIEIKNSYMIAGILLIYKKLDYKLTLINSSLCLGNKVFWPNSFY